ncbi:TetR/AcrR family transcriptional regulator [Haloechinothrix halophila]|uniref:TetR/AcrR family transcriptional regulator n=1 Tax=Haloechinothrix halophila TaxID=1069073 RepID=UPI0004227429|nr:TetR/AcrR family transcriptional regulator [Haloechinothrix halophila]
MARPRKTPSQQRSRFTYDIILEAAARVFDREGLAATTNRIAEAAGVSIGSLYQYFPNKHAILHELALRHLDHAEAEFTAALQRFRDTRPSLESVVTELVELAVRENTPFAQAHRLLREHAPRTPELTERFERLTTLLVDGLPDVLTSLGEDRDELRLRVRLAIAALDGQIHQIVLDTDTPEERDARTALAVEHCLRALTAHHDPQR